MVVDLAGHIRLIDFGLSEFENCYKSAEGGSIGYLSPEAIRGERCTAASDFYGLGTVLYELLTGNLPHYSINTFAMKQAVLSKPVQFPSCLSPACVDLLSGLLRKSPATRLSPEAVASHPWFAGVSWEAVMRKGTKPPFRPDLYESFAFVSAEEESKSDSEKDDSAEVDSSSSNNRFVSPYEFSVSDDATLGEQGQELKTQTAGTTRAPEETGQNV